MSKVTLITHINLTGIQYGRASFQIMLKRGVGKVGGTIVVIRKLTVTLDLHTWHCSFDLEGFPKAHQLKAWLPVLQGSEVGLLETDGISGGVPTSSVDEATDVLSGLLEAMGTAGGEI